MPTPRPESRSSASSSASIAAVASRVVLVTMPWRCADKMPALTPGVSPKSSALTMSRRLTGRSPRRRSLDHEPLDALGHPRRQGALEIVSPDVLEALVADAGKRLSLARHDRGHEADRFDLRQGRLGPEEVEDREDQPPARLEMTRRPRDHAVEQLPSAGPAVVRRRGRVASL